MTTECEVGEGYYSLYFSIITKVTEHALLIKTLLLFFVKSLKALSPQVRNDTFKGQNQNESFQV